MSYLLYSVDGGAAPRRLLHGRHWRVAPGGLAGRGRPRIARDSLRAMRRDHREVGRQTDALMVAWKSAGEAVAQMRRWLPTERVATATALLVKLKAAAEECPRGMQFGNGRLGECVNEILGLLERYVDFQRACPV